MEFVSHAEIVDLLDAHNIREVPDGEDRVLLRMHDTDLSEQRDSQGARGADRGGQTANVHIHLACPQTAAQPLEGATVVASEKERLPKIVEHVIHLLRMTQAVLIPVGKWRKVFDAVAFSLAGNEAWQEMDATATVELNTRDPLLCEPGDFHTLMELLCALMRDGDSPDQGLVILATASPVLIELVPDGAVRISLGSQVLADEVAEAFTGSTR